MFFSGKEGNVRRDGPVCLTQHQLRQTAAV